MSRLFSTVSFWIGVVILVAFALDQTLNGGTATVFLIRKLLDLIWWIAFWR